MTTTNTIAVQCKGVTKVYGSGGTQVHALRGVDIDIHTNELMMMVGPSGSGKTTLISIIAGVLDRCGGECKVFGHDYQTMTNNEKACYRKKTSDLFFRCSICSRRYPRRKT